MNVAHEKGPASKDYRVRGRLVGSECTKQTHVFEAGAVQGDLCSCQGQELSSTYGTGYFIKAKKLCVLAFVLFLGFSSSQATEIDDSVDNVGKQVDTLSGQVQDLGSDQNAAFTKLQTNLHNLQDQTNLSQGVLLVGGILLNSPGLTFNWPITLLPGTFVPTGLQADIVLPTGFSIVSITAGPAATAANKQVSASGNRFIIFGINQTAIGPGVVATVKLQATSGTAKRQYSIGLINPVVADKDGVPVCASAVSGTVEVL